MLAAVVGLWALEVSAAGVAGDIARAYGPISDGGNGYNDMSDAAMPMKRDMSVAGGAGVGWDALPSTADNTQ